MRGHNDTKVLWLLKEMQERKRDGLMLTIYNYMELIKYSTKLVAELVD
jgi:hypothetical protein